MFLKLAYNNFRKTYHIYLVYLFTLSLTIALFYGFTSIESSAAMELISESSKDYADTFMMAVNFTSYFVSFFVLFLMLYASNFFFKVRSQEFFVYKTLGANNRDLLKLIFSENLIIGVISSGFGAIIGIGINQLLNQVLVRYLYLDAAFSLRFDLGSFGMTILYFAIILILSSLISTRRIKKKSLIELKNIQTEITKKQQSKISSILIIILSIITLAISYVSGYFSEMSPDNILFYISIICGSLGTFIFYTGVINLKNTKFKQTPIKKDAFKNSLYINRLMKNKLSISIVSVSFVIILTTTFAANALIGMYGESRIPHYDATVYNFNAYYQEEYTLVNGFDTFTDLEKAGYTFENSAEIAEYNYYQTIDDIYFAQRIIGEEDFKQLM